MRLTRKSSSTQAVELNTPLGTLRGKNQMRAAVQSVVFLGLLAVFGVLRGYERYSGNSILPTPETRQQGAEEVRSLRSLDETTEVPSAALSGLNSTAPSEAPTAVPTTIPTAAPTMSPSMAPSSLPSSSPTKAACKADNVNVPDEEWYLLFYILGILYMFLALAIACDEFFVPALEEMSGPRRMNLSMDVAGATLMAAGGSAPELFTSVFGTFNESSVGFGTIVGSAVFNVLFVIAMCSLFSKDVLQLTWWPLFRDSSCYAVGLIVLAIFAGYSSEGKIRWWEAVILFLMYIGYILVMWQNANIYERITGEKWVDPEEEDDAQEAPAPAEENGGNGTPSRELGRGGSSRNSLFQRGGDGRATQVPHFRFQGTFRAGILRLLKDPESWMETAGVGIVAKIAGDANTVFQQVDQDGNGTVDREELKELFNLLECPLTATELEAVYNQLDEDGDGTISQSEFTNWYVRSEKRIMSQVRQVFDHIDANRSNTIDRDELRVLLESLDTHVNEEEVETALNDMYREGTRDEISFDEFSHWYQNSIVYERQKKLIEEDMEGVWENLYPPKDGSFREWAWYVLVLPLVLVMTFTIPDVRIPGWGHWCYFSFFASIAWIGFFSWIMVSSAEIVGKEVGIPDVIMGLTVLAAGTSVPDLLSSVIVARRGNGDMAVSSSIGSNIFDILVGLPIPWLLFTAVKQRTSVEIGAENIEIYLLVLLAMLVFVIAAVHWQEWKLTKTLGGAMFVCYFAFLAFSLYMEKDELGRIKC